MTSVGSEKRPVVEVGICLGPQTNSHGRDSERPLAHDLPVLGRLQPSQRQLYG